MSQKYEKLKNLLKELFQLDQPDLDFGLYRIMHARSSEISQFLDTDLLPQVKASFAAYQPADKAAIQKELEEMIATLKKAKVDYDTNTEVQRLRSEITEAADLTVLESEVYDHLYGFFRRYYSEGDYISKRVYKEGVYAIPYEGEEVKLHWANADQYYIKTSEYLRDYAFRLNPADDANPKRVHFRLADVAEGEHGNVKEAEGKNRVFVLASDNCISEVNKELIIKFEYRPARFEDWPEEQRAGKIKKDKDGKEKREIPSQKDIISIAEKRLFAVSDASLSVWISDLAKKHTKADGDAADYSKLTAHLNRYTARNTFDYFIHKDLGTFLNRELDFYIKNEVMHLDDVESETVPRVEQYLSKIKVIRKVAKKIIDFLSQLEDFQKKLWLKKKFVVETNYCITLARVPEDFYPEIAANRAQIEEWVKLFAIDEIGPTAGDLIDAGKPGYSVPLTVEFLKANDKLVLDTRFFSDEFKSKLIGGIENFDEQMDGLLIHSENFQALNLLQARYWEQVKCVYIDPPYNTGSDGFAYKDSYQHSSFLSLLNDRIGISLRLLFDDGVTFTSIGNDEEGHLRILLDTIFINKSIPYIWKSRAKPTNTGDAKLGPQIVGEFVYQNQNCSIQKYFPLTSGEIRRYPNSDEQGKFRNTTILTSNLGRYKRETMRFGIAGYTPPNDKRWKAGQVEIQQLFDRNRIGFNDEGEPFRKHYEGDEEEQHIPLWTFMPEEITGTAESGKTELSAIVGNDHGIDSVKPKELLCVFFNALTDRDNLVLDYFAGSGTTGHAVINLNREDQGKRKFILVEMGDYFDTVLKPRIQKVIYSSDWKDGKPTNRDTGITHCFKYLRLESYEDTLNNLDLRRTDAQNALLDFKGEGADKFKEDYILRYMLDVESRGSSSLLNIEVFTDPTAYSLKVKIPGSDESREVKIDLLETFNYLLGLQIKNISAPHTIAAEFERDSEKRLRIKGRIAEKSDGDWWFRTVTGTTLDGRKILVIWRKRPGLENPEGVEQDNLVLDTWFTKMGYSSKDSEFDLIYVNGTNNLENLKTPDDLWKVRLIEEDFKRLMFEDSGV
ncbi:MAG: site-specific DNA-methyltransferase [Spirochaetales bacterium]|nr:site-specific DNA-methyltransferase [Spirochaetales bacterium]